MSVRRGGPLHCEHAAGLLRVAAPVLWTLSLREELRPGCLLGLLLASTALGFNANPGKKQPETLVHDPET